MWKSRLLADAAAAAAPAQLPAMRRNKGRRAAPDARSSAKGQWAQKAHRVFPEAKEVTAMPDLEVS
jgi:hypothetical protein